MIPRTIVVILLGCVAAFAAPVPKESKQKPDAERIQGVWDFEFYDIGGAKRTGTRWFFDKDKMYSGGVNTTDNKGTEYGIVLRPVTSPAQMDYRQEGVQGLACCGIYKFVGDDLHIAYYSGAERPKDFSSAAGKHVIILKRVPEPKK